METSIKDNSQRKTIPIIKKVVPNGIIRFKRNSSLSKYMSVYLITFVTISIIIIGFLVARFL
jgi:hypothetical protein